MVFFHFGARAIRSLQNFLLRLCAHAFQIAKFAACAAAFNCSSVVIPFIFQTSPLSWDPKKPNFDHLTTSPNLALEAFPKFQLPVLSNRQFFGDCLTHAGYFAQLAFAPYIVHIAPVFGKSLRRFTISEILKITSPLISSK